MRYTLFTIVSCSCVVHDAVAFTTSSYKPQTLALTKKVSSPLFETSSVTQPDVNDVEAAINTIPDESSSTTIDSKSSSSSSNISSTAQSPAEYENTRFECDPSVEFWMNFQKDGLYEANENLSEVVNVANRFASKGGDALSYWFRHNIRSGYFITNAVLGTVASNIHERIRSKDIPENGFINNLVRAKVISRLVLETVLAYEQDYQRIESGKYKLPYDMYAQSEQTSPIFALQQTGMFVREAVGTLTRRNRGSEDDKKVWFDNDAMPDLYPKYYRTAYHYQTDGWMSHDSASVYDTSTETLFLGRQDAMQRITLVPVVEYAKEVVVDRPLKVLEVACGTGRFMTFARDNLPLDTEFTAIDLSPFYLGKARDNDSKWRSLRKRVEKEENGVGIETKIEPATFVQAQAENLPFGDEEFDAVICVYLFHEIPREIRAKVASEMARVTKKGGRVVLTDSSQLGDRPVFDGQIGNFGKMNEPHYRDYIEDKLPIHFEEAGLECLTKISCSASKSLSFRK